MAKADPTTETVTVVFTDLVESTELTTRVGTERAEALVRTHLEALDDAIAHAGGRRVKRLGDGSMAVFPSASAALACAVAMQRATDAGRRRGAHPLRMRVGIGAGDVLVEDGDCSGAPVVEAARLCALADGGQILATELVGLLGGRRTSATVTALGPRELKGLPDPVDVVEVAWAAPDGASPRQRAGSGPLLERAGEVARLEGAFAEAREGRSSVVLVEGPAGTGKTRLLDTACDAAAGAGVLVLRARGTELERPYGWGVAHSSSNGGCWRRGRRGGRRSCGGRPSRRGSPSGRRPTAVATSRSARCTASRGSWSTPRRPRRWPSSSTTPSGPTRRPCDGWPTSARGSTTCRSRSWWRRATGTSPRARRSCSSPGARGRSPSGRRR